MFVAIYSFKVKEDHEDDLIESWTQLTKLIYEYEGSLGSRLHKVDDSIYIAYAQWPDKETWEKSGDKLPVSSKQVSSRMRESCHEIKTEFTGDVVSDLLVK